MSNQVFLKFISTEVKHDKLLINIQTFIINLPLSWLVIKKKKKKQSQRQNDFFFVLGFLSPRTKKIVSLYIDLKFDK